MPVNQLNSQEKNNIAEAVFYRALTTAAVLLGDKKEIDVLVISCQYLRGQGFPGFCFLSPPCFIKRRGKKVLLFISARSDGFSKLLPRA